MLGVQLADERYTSTFHLVMASSVYKQIRSSYLLVPLPTLNHSETSCFTLDNTKDVPDRVLPIFITVDPARDDVRTVAEYIKGNKGKLF